jgi:hypothetical protein
LAGNASTTPTTNFIGTTDNEPLAFRTNNTENMRLTSAGNLGIGTTTPNAHAQVDIVASGRDPLHAEGNPGAGIPNSFIVQNNTAGNAKSQFTFRDSTGANRYSFGNDAASNNGQNFYIYDEVNQKTMLSIDSSGVHTLDLIFANGVRATEDGSGLAFKNKAGNKIAVIDAEGNLHIKGNVIKDL